ncbi:hypothetical protein TruAng_002619 [Truncatella angustata]|nr:hypothetical protein TruAng_002619 [Truncatella angustata]
MVLALGCQYIEHIPATQRSQFADSFYRRSQQLISVETLDFSSLQIVQLLLLRGLYLHYTNYADRCWNIIGVALRVAQGLGLHLEEAVAPKNQLNREMRRRVWHNCVALDRLSATTFGRSVLLRKPYDVPLPEPIDDEYLSKSHEGCQPENTPSRLTFFRHTIKLFDVLDEILTKLYSHEHNGPAEDVSTIAPYLNDLPRLCSKLDFVSESLPTHLRTPGNAMASEDGSGGCFNLQARVFKSSLCPDLNVNLDLDCAKTSWERAMRIFEFYEPRVESARKGSEVLTKFRQRFSAFSMQNQSSDFINNQVSESMTFNDDPIRDENWLAGVAEEFDELFTSSSLERSWLSAQDFGWVNP